MTLYRNGVGGDHQGPTHIIAASDSLNSEYADYVCSGVDDQVEFNAAVANGGHIVAMKGSYVFPAEVVLPDNTTLEFLPGSSIFVPSPHSMTVYTKNTDPFSAIITNSDHTVGNENIKVIGADIDFNGDNGKSLTQGWAGIWLDNCEKSEVIDCRGYDVVYNVNWANGRAFGILLSDCDGCKVIRCEGNHCGYEGIGIRGDCTNVFVQGCCGYTNRQHILQGSCWAPTYTGTPIDVIFEDCIGDGNILFHGSVGHGCKNVVIQNCIVETVQIIGEVSHGSMLNNIVDEIDMNNTGGGILKDILITNNILNRSTSGATIDIYGNTNGGSVSNVVISNNHLQGGYVRLRTSTTCNVSQILIDGNTIISDSYTARCAYIAITGAGSVTDVAITNTLYDQVGTDFCDCSIAGNGDIENIHVHDNMILNCRRLVSLIYSSGTGLFNHLKVNDNLIANSASTIVRTDTAAKLNHVHIDGNKIISANYIFAGGMDDVRLTNNIFDAMNAFDDSNPTNVVVRDNAGYVTENSGTDTIPSASTSKVVTHGLAVTPAAGDVMVTPMESLGNASFFWVDTYTSTQFTINTNAAPGADTDFAWKAIVL